MQKVTLETIRQWQPLSTMEGATEDVYRERIEAAYACDLPHQKLTPIPYVGNPEAIVHHNYEHELVALCPVTFLPDVYGLFISYNPGEYIPELKSLKLYLMDFIALPISHEHLLSKIYETFVAQIKPKSCKMKLVTNIRGGIETIVELGSV